MPEYKRVRLESGAEITVANVTDGMTVLDGVRAVDRNGRPLGDTHPEKAGDPARKPYDEWTVPELEAEIEARNDARGDEEPQIAPAPPKNKPQLVEALQADDAS